MTGGSDAERKGHKRKLADALAQPSKALSKPIKAELSQQEVAIQVKSLVENIEKHLQKPPDVVERNQLRRAAHSLAELSKIEDNVDQVVASGAIKVVVPLLSYFKGGNGEPLQPCCEEVEKEACFILGLLAIKQDYQAFIAEAGALPGLVALLKRYVPFKSPPNPGASVVRRSADAITNLAHENVSIKSKVRAEDGIPPLVALLEAYDPKVQRAAAGALRTLAFKNEENKNQIVECNALPTLIHMLRAEDSGIHYEAVGVIGNLVHSSNHIKRKVLDEGALQPVIGLLSSKCHESQREAALLLGQFATAEPDYKAKIVQRGAVPPLIDMLRLEDVQLKEMAAFALGRLAQNSDNQAGIVQAGGLGPLLDLMESQNGNLQHNAAFALYGLADNEDNIAAIVRGGGVQTLQACEQLVQPSRDCVQKTLKRLEDRTQGKVLGQIIYSLISNNTQIQQRTAVALTRLVREQDLCHVFVERKGIDVLINMLVECKKLGTPQKEAAEALLLLAKKANELAPLPGPPAPQNSNSVYLGNEYVNNPTMSDVTFLVEGRKFYSHRIALLASSDTFKAMFDGHYREKEASIIPIPNYSYAIFESTMRCIYTGHVEIEDDMAEELLRAADQYMLDGLKQLCEGALERKLSIDSLYNVMETSENFNAPQLNRKCVLFALANFAELFKAYKADPDLPDLSSLMKRMLPRLKESISEQLQKGADEY